LLNLSKSLLSGGVALLFEERKFSQERFEQIRREYEFGIGTIRE